MSLTQVSYPVSPSPSGTLKMGQPSAPSSPPLETPKRFVRPAMTGVVVNTIGKIGRIHRAVLSIYVLSLDYLCIYISTIQFLLSVTS